MSNAQGPLVTPSTGSLTNSYSGHSMPSSMDVDLQFTGSFWKDANYLLVSYGFAAVHCYTVIVDKAMAAGMCDYGCCHIAPPPEQPLAAISVDCPCTSAPSYVGLASSQIYISV